MTKYRRHPHHVKLNSALQLKLQNNNYNNLHSPVLIRTGINEILTNLTE